MASNVCWLLASVSVKLSLAWLFDRIFVTIQFRRWTSALMVVTVCYGISFFVVYLKNCRPIDQLWHPQPNGHCRNMAIGDYATIAINTILGLVILILPLPTLWGLKLHFYKMDITTIMLGLGLLWASHHLMILFSHWYVCLIRRLWWWHGESW
jgi:archaellum biogenesis protein FlaJ (TadC family)